MQIDELYEAFGIELADGQSSVQITEGQFQLMVLHLLAGIQSGVGSGGAGTERAVTITDFTANGTVAAGAKMVAFSFSADFVGSVAGRAIDNTGGNPIGSLAAIYAPPGDTLGAIAYTRTAGTLTVTKLV